MQDRGWHEGGMIDFGVVCVIIFGFLIDFTELVELGGECSDYPFGEGEVRGAFPSGGWLYWSLNFGQYARCGGC